jgi:hypothetical protein
MARNAPDQHEAAVWLHALPVSAWSAMAVWLHELHVGVRVRGMRVAKQCLIIHHRQHRHRRARLRISSDPSVRGPGGRCRRRLRLKADIGGDASVL